MAVSINGNGPYDFLLDTGAAATMVDESIAQKLNLQAMAHIPLRTITGAPKLPLVPSESIAVGPASLPDVKVVCCNLRRLLGFGYAIKGVLGQDFLSRFNYLLSYRDKELVFETGNDLPDRLAGRRIECERRQSKFYVHNEKEGECQRFLLDSGSLEPPVFAHPGALPNLDVICMGRNHLVAETSAGRRNMRFCRVRAFRISDLTWKNIRFTVADLLPGEERYEDGLLPLCLFESIYFNSEENYVILNPVVLERGRSSIRHTSMTAVPCR